MSTVKTNFIVYRFSFRGPVHLGDSRPDDYGNSADFLHSDTLYAALLATMAKMGLSVPGEEGPGYTLSSCFPFATDPDTGAIAYFFPKPLLSFNLGSDDIDFAKELKNIRWVDAEYFGRILRGETLDFGGPKRPDIKGKMLTKANLSQKQLMVQSPGQRVTVSRTEKDATPFLSQRLFFGPQAGLFCLFRGDEASRNSFEVALNLLQHEGIGTDRNVGNGHFSFKKDTLEIKLPREGNYAVNLSLFCPEDKAQFVEMLRGKRAAYQIIRRGGWITSPDHLARQKRSVGMLTEGSVLFTDHNEAGRVAIDLAPLDEKQQSIIDHPVWRNGRAIFLPCKISD
jgi:CRISPR-associated protein Csm4